jgi:multidrug efflux pump
MFAKPMVEDGPKRDGLYMRFVGRAVRHPFIVVFLTIATLIAVPVAYGKYGNGVEFFPDVEPDYGLLYVHARGTCRWTRRTRGSHGREQRHRLAGPDQRLYACWQCQRWRQ